MGKYSILPNQVIDTETKVLSNQVSIDVPDSQSALSLVYDIICHHLNTKQNFTIYTDDNKANLLKAHLNLKGLPFVQHEIQSSYTGTINKNTQPIDFTFLSKMYLSKIEAIVTDLGNLYNPVVEGKSIANLIQQKTDKIPYLHYDLLSLLKIEDDHFELTAGVIKNAAQYYDPQFEQSPNFSSKNLQLNINLHSLTDVDHITTEIENNLNSLKDLREQFIQAMLLMEGEVKQQSDSKYLKLLQFVNDFNHKYVTFTSIYGEKQPAKPTLLRIVSKSKVHYKAYEKLVEACQDLVLEFNNFDAAIDFPSYKDLRGVKLTLDFCKSILSGWTTYYRIDLTNRFKRANPLNTEITEIKDVYTSLQSILNSMNTKEIFLKPIECNSKSTSKQFDFTVDLINQLSNVLKDLLVMPHYYKWLQIVNDLDENTKKILNVLKTFPTNQWNDIFENNYVRALIKSKLHPGIIKTEEALTNILESYLTSLTGRKNDYLMTFQKNKEGKGSSGIFSTRTAQKFSPISIKSLSELPSKNTDEHGMIWSEDLVFLDKGYEVFENYALIHQISDSNEIRENNHSTYQGFTSFYEDKIDDIAISERIISAKLLAKALKAITGNPRIFHHKNGNIISFGSQSINDKINSSFPKIKEFKNDPNNYDLLVESILETSRKQYLIVKDGFLCPEDLDSFMWQLYIIDYVKKAGFTILYEWSLGNNTIMESLTQQFQDDSENGSYA